MIATYISHDETPECKDNGSERSNVTNFDGWEATSGDDDNACENNDVSHYCSSEVNASFLNEGLYTSDWIGERFREDEYRWRTDAAQLGGRRWTRIPAFETCSLFEGEAESKRDSR